MRKVLFISFLLFVSVAKAEILPSSVANPTITEQNETWDQIEKELNDPNVEWTKAEETESSEVKEPQNKEQSANKKEKSSFWSFVAGYSFGKMFK